MPVAESGARPISARSARTMLVAAAMVAVAVLGFAVPVAGLVATHTSAAPHAGVAVHSPYDLGGLSAPTSASPRLSPIPSLSHGAAAPAAIPPAPQLGHFQLPGPHPAAWGTAAIPPGAEALNALQPRAASGSGGNPANGTAAWQNRFCAGLWPYAANDSASQAYYWDGCYGHDEPGIESYSPLAGSGGNVSWTVTLPVDRNATANQSDLYSAIWFGLTLNDPLAWMHQCFLELQFYPDQTFTNGPGLPNPAWTVNGAWIGAAVAWQIEAATGYEDPCFYQPLFNGSATGGASYFNMSQGDHIVVTFSGWSTSAYGENLTIDDLTTGTSSIVNLWDFAGNYPLNPSYSTNTYENGLQWTPGGEYPAVFAFENGHAGNPSWPSNNPYGGCSPGKPPANAFYSSVPCPSYDPGSWSNDTAVPWHISSPTFFNGESSDAHPAQVAFTQDFGGVGAISQIGGGSCDGQLGSAWCSYPWYSYSCAAQAFEFGATDYPGVSADFGQFNEYSPVLETNGLGFGYYPPTNFSMPTCGQASFNVTVATSGVPGGAVYFLSHADYAPTNVSGLLAGNYSIYPAVPAGAYFQGWTVSGGAHLLGSPNDTWATLVVTANGSVTAWFTTSPTWTNVTFDDVGTTVAGTIVVSPTRTFTNGIPLGIVSSGTTLKLAPGVYGVQALPPAGANFTQWSTAGAGLSLAPDQFPYAWLDVNGLGGNVTLTAQYAASSLLDYAYVIPSGFGTIELNGTNYSSASVVSLPVGAYPLVAEPANGWGFAGWGYGSSGVMTDFNASTFISLENSASFSPTYIIAYFVATVTYNVTLNDSPTSAGTVSIYGPFSGLPSGTTVPVVPGDTTVYAFASSGWNFTGWEVDNSSAAWIFAPNESSSAVQINGSVTITAEYASAPVGTIHFYVSPAGTGFVQFNGGTLGLCCGQTATASNGTYPISGYGNGSYYLLGLVANGSGTIVPTFSATFLNFTAWVGGAAGDANVTAYFAPFPPPPPPGLPVTFVSTEPNGVSATIGGTPVGNGGTLWLTPGTYAVALSAGTNTGAFDGWTATPGLSLGNAGSLNTSLVLTTSGGTLTAIVAPFAVPAMLVSPSPTEVGVATTFHGIANGTTGPYSYSWTGLPGGCASANVTTLVCTPTTAGTFSIQLGATDVFGDVGLSPTFSLVVVAGLTVVSVGGNPAAVDVGVPTTIATTTVGGVGTLEANYTALPTGCTEPAGSPLSFSCTPTAVGVQGVSVTVTDGLNVNASGSGTLTVNPVPSVATFTASLTTTDVGVATTLTATVAGGTAPFSYGYTGLPTGCTSSNAASLSCTPTASGASVVTVTVTDADHLTATQTLSVTVNPAPAVSSFTASRAAVDVGLETVLTAVAAGGTGTLSYAYTGLPTGCASANALSVSCTPTAAGSATVTITATDGIGGVGKSALTVTVNAKPTIASATFAPGTVDTGSATTLTVSATGGTGSLVYSYSGLPSGCSSSDTATLSCTPSSSGTFSVGVTVTDSLGAAANSSASLTVNEGSSGGILGLPGAIGYALIGLLVVVIVIVAIVWMMRGRGKAPAKDAGPATPSSGDSSAPTTTGPDSGTPK